MDNCLAPDRSKKYADLTKDQLIALLRQRDETRLGLVWERDSALVGKDESVNKKFVTLDHVPDASCGSAPYRNLIIEGDNYDALRLLRMTHAGQVKCIYIDPPYNTGNRDFIYNDRFVDKTDAWRHSKWIEFMHRRLLLAKDLLRKDGVIFVSIDDNELFHLGMLMNKVFGEGNFVASIVWQKRTSPDARINLGPAHDYILVYSRNIFDLKPTLKKIPLSVERTNSFKNPDNDFRGVWASVDMTGQTGHATKEQFFEITAPSGTVFRPPNGRCWAFSKSTVDKLINENRVWFGKDGKSRPRLKQFLSEREGGMSWSWWTNTEVGHNQEATKELATIMQKPEAFTNPKPVRLIDRILRIATNPNDLILDFFAGSGTTGHAVLKLNAEDGGNRRFILVSSTEATKEEPDKNLCRDVCAKRVRRVCEGYGEVEGLGGNFAYLRVRRLSRGKVVKKLAHEQVWIALQLMHLEGLVPEPPSGAVWEAGGEEKPLIYLPKADKATLVLLKKKKLRRAVIYSWQSELVKQNTGKGVSVRPIPQFLMERFGIKP